MKYQRKPVYVDAFRWGHDPEPKWWKEMSQGFERQFGAGTIFVPVASGTIQCMPGDWIILEDSDRLTATDNDSFEKYYTKVKLDKPEQK